VLDPEGLLRLSAKVPEEVIQRRGRATTRARWIAFDVQYSRQYERLLRDAAERGAAGIGQYSVRLFRLSPGQYRATITLKEPVAHRKCPVWEEIPTWCARVGGVDLNLDRLAMVVTDGQGQFRAWQVLKFENLGEPPRNKARWQIGNVARDVIRWLQDQGARAIAIGDLNISKSGGGSARFHRRTVPYSYRRLTQALARTALRASVIVKRVNPACTSWIGHLKYAGQYGVSVHVAAPL
jgi:IS605 OrfB family transposase